MPQGNKITQLLALTHASTRLLLLPPPLSIPPPLPLPLLSSLPPIPRPVMNIHRTPFTQGEFVKLQKRAERNLWNVCFEGGRGKRLVSLEKRFRRRLGIHACYEIRLSSRYLTSQTLGLKTSPLAFSSSGCRLLIMILQADLKLHQSTRPTQNTSYSLSEP